MKTSFPVLRSWFVGCSLLLLAVITRCSANELRHLKLSSRAVDAFESGAEGAAIQRNSVGDGLVLYDVTLVEDDAPGIGSDADFLDVKQRAPTILVTGDVRVKKILNVQQPLAHSARLYLPDGLSVELNGVAISGAADGKFREVPVSLLKRGDNEVVLSASAGRPRFVKIAPRGDILLNAPDRKQLPARTFTSTDAGQHWSVVDGEAMVRLLLTQYLE